jgi:S-adenosylmethionine hydrolase
MTPTITLTTDFGTRDSYVAQVKAVLLERGPADLRIVDLGHEIAPQALREGAFFLRTAVPRFPRGTIHLAVIDPGVGSARRPLAVESEGQLLVGPDNGLFGWLLGPHARAHTIARDPNAAVASTFHARDLFAPAAARLACGEPLEALGPELGDPLILRWPEPELGERRVSGEIVHVDRYGNLISNVTRAHVPAPSRAHVVLLDRELGVPRDHYAQAASGELLALFGSEGLLEVAARDANAAQITGASVGTELHVLTA